MAQTVLLKRSSVAGNVPDSSDLSLGEIAVNTADGAVYIKKGNNDIVAVADNDILHIDTTNGRVGIGTTAPAYKLDVHGIISLTDAIPKILFTDSGTNTTAQISANSSHLTYTTATTARDHQFKAGSATLMYIEGTGNVGIGTVSPGTKLHINSGASDVVSIFESTDTYADIRLKDNDGSSYIRNAQGNLFLQADRENAVSNTTIRFHIDDSEKARIDSSGNLLVGATSYAGNSSSVTGSGLSDGYMWASRSSNEAAIFNRLSTDGEVVLIRKNGSDVGEIGTYNSDLHIGTGDTGIGFNNASRSIVPMDPSTPDFAGSLISLGTSSVKFKDLHLSGTAYAQYFGSSADTNTLIQFAGSDDIRFRAGGTEQMRIKTTGVGIGTSSPTHLLHVNGTTATILAQSTNAGSNASIWFNSNVGGTQANRWEVGTNISAGSSFEVYDRVNGASRMVINSSGNIGIGTTSPLGKLSVGTGSINDASLPIQISTGVDGTQAWYAVNRNGAYGALFGYSASSTWKGLVIRNVVSGGTANADAISFATNNNDIRMHITGDGKVGIGTSSPANLLSVESTGQFAGINIKSASSNGISYIDFGDADDNNIGGINYDNSTDTLQFRNGNTNHVFLKSSGNLGIGTGSPSRKLHVSGSGATVGIKVEATDGNQASLDLTNTEGAVRLINDGGAFQIYDDTDTAQRLHISTAGAITFNSAYTFPAADGSANQVLQTDGSGNLSFGTAAGGGVSISNNANNRVLTGDGTNANAEANLTFDGSTLGVTGNITVSGTVDGRDIATDGSKLDGIEANATADQTASEILTAIKTVDGSGSNLDADKLDGLDSTSFRRRIFSTSINATPEARWIAFTKPHISTSGTSEYYHLDLVGYSDIGQTQSSLHYSAYIHVRGNGTATNIFEVIIEERHKAGSDQFTFGKKQVASTSNIVYFIFPEDYSGVEIYNLSDDAGAISTASASMFSTTDTDPTGITTITPREPLHTGDDISVGNIDLADNGRLRLGTSDDLQIYHDTSSSLVRNFTGALYIQNDQDDGNIIFRSDNGSGGIAEYIVINGGNGSTMLKHYGSTKLVTTATGVEITGNLDSPQISINDYISHNGDSNTFLGFDAADTFSLVTGGTTALSADANATHLRYQGSAKLSTAADGIILTSTDATNAAGPVIDFNRDSASPADADYLGQLKFRGENDADQDIVFAKITAKAADVSDGTEDGAIEFTVKKAGSNNINARLSANNLDLINGTGLSVAGNATITGNLTVNGSTTTLNTATLSVEDKNITLNKGSGDTSGSADGAGITIQDAVDASTDATILWDASNDKFTFSHAISPTNILINDNNKIRFGNSQDLEIYHDGSNSIINDNGTGTIRIQTGGSNQWEFNGVNFKGNDGRKIILGDSSDLQIYHNGSDSYIQDTGTGVLAILSNETRIQNSAGTENCAKFTENGAVTLFYDNNPRLATSSAGTDFTGNVTVNVDSSSTGFGNHQAALRIDNTNATANNWASLVFDSNNGSSADISAKYTDHTNNYADLYFSNRGSGGYTAKMVILQSGNVGIGETSPDGKLHIKGGTATGDASHILFENTQGSKVFAIGGGATGVSNNNLFFRNVTDNTRPMVITDAGNVGIGTDSPADRLVVQSSGTMSGGATNANSYFTVTNGSYGLYHDPNEIFSDINGSFHIGANHASGVLRFHAGGTDTRMIILANGNVGIGTASPGSKLTVEGDIRQTTGDLLYSGGGNWDLKHLADDQNIVFYTSQSGSATEKMRIKANGNVGIGTSSLTNKFHVSGNARIEGNFMAGGASATNVPAVAMHIKSSGANAALRIEDTTSSNQSWDLRSTHGTGLLFIDSTQNQTRMTIDDDGYVGIGESSPVHKVEAKGTDAALVVHNDGNSRGGVAALSSQRVAFTSTSVNDDLVFGRTANPVASSGFVERMRIDNGTGYVGIGTTSPSTKLHIDQAGNTRNDGLFIERNGSTYGLNLYVNSGGYGVIGGNGGFTGDIIKLDFNQEYVGIGTEPSAKLQVEEYGIDTTSTSSSATTQIAIHSFAAATFRSARFTVQVTNSTDSTYHTTELLLIHDGTTANITEFGEIHTGSAKEATFDADINSGNVRLLATPATTDSMAFKVVAHAITT